MNAVFYASMFDFGKDEVPEHYDDDPAWYRPAAGTWSIVDSNPRPPTDELVVACHIPSQDMAASIGRARLRKIQPGIDPNDVWIEHPDGQRTRVLSDAAIFDAAGSEVEREMVSSYRALSSAPVGGADGLRIDPLDYDTGPDGSNPTRQPH